VKRKGLSRKAPWIRPKSKLGNRRTLYQGRWFDSRLEQRYAQYLDLMKRVEGPDQVLDVKYQVTVRLDVGEHHICNYRADFRVTFADGRVEYHETKGFETEVWKIKERLFRALRPNEVLRVIREVPAGL